jgi:hypothetical protein
MMVIGKLANKATQRIPVPRFALHLHRWSLRYTKRMKSLLSLPAFAFLLLLYANNCIAGPAVVPHPKSPAVKVWDSKFVVIQEFKDPKKIKAIQGIFLRAKRVGDTSTHLKTSTHKIDFSDRWLLDVTKGEIGVLSKAVVDVYQIEPKDLKALLKLIKSKA